jgi:hypothetical protein
MLVKNNASLFEAEPVSNWRLEGAWFGELVWALADTDVHFWGAIHV